MATRKASHEEKGKKRHGPFHEWLQARILAVGLGGPAGLATAMNEAGHSADRRNCWRWATGKRLPDRQAWPALAEALQVPLDQLALRVFGVTPMGGEE